MKISIHNITHGHFTMDVYGEETIGAIKKKIRALKNYPVSQQELLFNSMFKV